MGNKFYNKEFCVIGDWYEPAKVMLKNYRSIVDAWYFDEKKDSCNWCGWIVQKIGKTFHLIPFGQDKWGGIGYVVYTGCSMYYGDSVEECRKAANMKQRLYKNK